MEISSALRLAFFGMTNQRNIYMYIVLAYIWMPTNIHTRMHCTHKLKFVNTKHVKKGTAKRARM